ncbi:hypothetical protein HDU93_005750 [Gonapodya sp. JEL0774]|nr:hypothetical protein HDU93_005750 [Gonapodya sp. JEL0774]
MKRRKPTQWVLLDPVLVYNTVGDIVAKFASLADIRQVGIGEDSMRSAFRRKRERTPNATEIVFAGYNARKARNLFPQGSTIWDNNWVAIPENEENPLFSQFAQMCRDTYQVRQRDTTPKEGYRASKNEMLVVSKSLESLVAQIKVVEPDVRMADHSSVARALRKGNGKCAVSGWYIYIVSL